ncbi:MAG: SpoIIE family protein phosphatase [Bacteroidia bacterium]|nr:SpoIIE family protein phosphatase [Bacteroidia bacterium]
MKRFVIVCFLVTLLFNLTGQVNKYGVPFVKNYSTQITQGSEQNWCIARDAFGNMYFGNQDRGVICYDGTKWSSIQIKDNPRIYSLAADKRGIVYVGGAFEFGYLHPSEKGTTEYVSLSERIDSVPKIQVISSIEVQDNKALYLGPRFIFIYNTENDSLSEIDLVQYGITDALRLVKINDRLIIADNTSGIFELKGTTISPLKGGDFFKAKPCTVVLPFDESRMLIGTYFEGLFLYDYNSGTVRSNFIDEHLNAKFKTANIYAGAKISNDLFAIGTTNQEGVLVFNKSGELIYQLTKETSGLVDDAVYAMYSDYQSNSELWIATYGFLNKAYFNVPITIFGEKQGIDYGVNDIAEFQGKIYLSYDAGILETYTDNENFLRFRKVPQTDGQFFPLELIKTSHSEFLLTGSLDGVLQILDKDVVLEVEKNIKNLPKSDPRKYNTKKILQSSIDRDIVFLGTEAHGITILRDEGSHWSYINRIKGFTGSVSSMVEKEEGGLWFISDDPSALFNLTFSGNDTSYIRYGIEKGIPEIEISSVYMVNDKLYVTTASGLLRYDKQNDTFISDNSLTGGYSEGKISRNLFLDGEGDIWYSGTDKKNVEMLFRNSSGEAAGYQGDLNLLPNVPSMDILFTGNKTYLTQSKNFIVLDKARLLPDSTKVNTRFTSITVGTDSVIMTGTFHSHLDEKRRVPEIYYSSSTVPQYSYDMNQITFEWTTPYFIEELLTEYSCKLEGYDKDWSKWEGISFGYSSEAIYSKREYPKLPYGHYTFRVRSKTLTGLTGNELKYEFVINKPWYATILAFFGYALAAILAIWGLISYYTRRLKNENIRLEGIVRERTAVVVKQKEELESSIHYASRIQMALLPSQTILTDNIKENFVLFRPRDIVSGDFYWMTKKGDRLYIVAADCTGHGVPGAFMSLLGMSFLDEIIDRELAPRADVILNQLRLHVTESLKQSGGDDEAKDGMDMGLLVLDYKTSHIEFSGAYNPCFKVRKLTDEERKNYKEDSDEMPDGSMSNGKYLLETIYASKMPIGISSRMKEDFVFYDWNLEKGISYYLFSDGYIDQFGGPHGRKFMKKNFKRLILEIQEEQMCRQRDRLEKNLIDWIGQGVQIDDILVLGIKT